MKEKRPFQDLNDEEFEKYLFEFVRAGLRRFSYRWPYRTIATTKARIGYGKYTCAQCLVTVANKDKRLDHVKPVVDPKIGFIGWESFIRRLLVREDEFQVLCGPCHKAKTKEENDVRREVRKANRINSSKQQGVSITDKCPICSKLTGMWD